MKRAMFIAVIISIMMTGCKTQQKAVSVSSDDVYSTPSRNQKPKTSNPDLTQNLSTEVSGTQSVARPDSIKPNTAAEDYSDVSYAARIQKFQHAKNNQGYFDNTSVDSASGCCNNPNVNINFGYGGGAYDWGSSFSIGFGMGWGYGAWDYGWGYPYYSWWYNPYWWGYYPYPYYYGYGYYPYSYWDYPYYNSYYGPRRNVATTTAYTRNDRTNPGNTAADARNPRAIPDTKNTRAAIPPDTRGNGQAAVLPRSSDPASTQRKPPASQERYRYTPPSNGRQNPYARNAGNTNYRGTRQQPAPKYHQPDMAPVQRQGKVQNYTPNNYRQARSSQEYISPRVQAQNNAGRPATTAGNRGTNASSSQRGTTSAGSGTRSYSGPGTSGHQYGSPRSYSPGNYSRSSSPGFSSPSRGSSGGYSAPSGGGHSGGSGGGGGGSGHSGGGGGGGGGGSPRR